MVLASQVQRLLGKSQDRTLVAFTRVFLGEKWGEAASVWAQLLGQSPGRKTARKKPGA